MTLALCQVLEPDLAPDSPVSPPVVRDQAATVRSSLVPNRLHISGVLVSVMVSFSERT